MGRLYRLRHHSHQVVAQGIQVGLLSQPRVLGSEGLRRVVLSTVEAPVDEFLHTPPQRLKERRYRQRGGDNRELRLLPRERSEDPLDNDDRAQVEED